MVVGELNRVVVFKKNTPVAQGAGNADSYATLLTTRGRLRKQSGSRSFGFGELAYDNSFELIVRYDSTLAANLSVSLKVEIDSKTYTITSHDLIDDRQQYYKMNLTLQN